MTEKQLAGAIKEWVGKNYGSQEADNPSWNIKKLAAHIASHTAEKEIKTSSDKTNFQMMQEVKKHYKEHTDITKGFLMQREIDVIDKAFNLQGRSALDLQNCRDFVVAATPGRTTNSPTEKELEEHDRNWDMMSAITHRIDSVMLSKEKGYERDKDGQVSKEQLAELKDAIAERGKEGKEREKFPIDPMRVYKDTGKAVLVKADMPGQIEKKQIWLEKFRVGLDKEGQNVVAVDKFLQQKYGDVLTSQKQITAKNKSM